MCIIIFNYVSIWALSPQIYFYGVGVLRPHQRDGSQTRALLEETDDEMRGINMNVFSLCLEAAASGLPECVCVCVFAQFRA